MLVGQEVIDPPEGYATPYSSSRSQQEASVIIPAGDTFHSFKRLMGKRCACIDNSQSAWQPLHSHTAFVRRFG